MVFKCQHCEKDFSTQGNLIKHQKTAKFCLEIQAESNFQETEIVTFNCNYCNKNFTSNHHLNKHKKNCVSKFKTTIEELKQQLLEKDKQKEDENDVLASQLSAAQDRIIELENQLKTVRLEVENELIKERNDKLETTVEEIAKQPKNQQINNKIIITTPLDLSSQAVQQAIESNFSHEHLTMGQKGVARFAYDNMLKDEQGKLKYICTDPSRQVFQYKNDKGVIQKDVRATKLTKALLEADIKQTSHKIAWDNMKDGDNEIFLAYTNRYQDIQELEQDNSDFSKELSCLAI